MRIKNHKGFTFIELIMVLVVATIIGVIVLSRLMSSGTELIAQTDVIKAHLRYAQARAMKRNEIWGITCAAGDYWHFKDSTSNPVQLPGETANSISLTSLF